jgi:hypothetical protein
LKKDKIAMALLIMQMLSNGPRDDEVVEAGIPHLQGGTV